MEYFHYQQQHLFAEKVSITELAEKYGTPCFIYSRAAIEENWQKFDRALTRHPHLICYAVKANSNLAILNLLARLGSGFDVVSGGELQRVIAAGGDPEKIVFSGVGKSVAEITQALQANIYCFNVESMPELLRINALASAMEKTARVAIRINPNIDAKTHRYISTGLKENKFGIDYERAIEAFDHAAELSSLEVMGIDCHIGSQLTELSPFVDATYRLLEMIDTLKKRGIPISHVDVGGGFGVRYQDENPPGPEAYAEALGLVVQDPQLKIIIEPGRAIVANAGILMTQVEYVKFTAHKNFLIVDAGMNDLIRPSLYDAWHHIIPVHTVSKQVEHSYDVVGPVCETGDFFGKDRKLAIAEGDYLAILGAGAYGFSMSSNYNSRPRAAEILVDGDHAFVIRQREKFSDLYALEQVLP